MEEVRSIIEERRVSPRSDFISDLVNARDQGDKLSDSELFDQIFGICGASLSATRRAAGGALYLLYTHLEQLIRNPALIPDALEECFRLASNGYFHLAAHRHSPHRGRRHAHPQGSLAPNYDPDVFPDPTRLDIQRKPKRILPFAYVSLDDEKESRSWEFSLLIGTGRATYPPILGGVRDGRGVLRCVGNQRTACSAAKNGPTQSSLGGRRSVRERALGSWTRIAAGRQFNTYLRHGFEVSQLLSQYGRATAKNGRR
jgi:cytochrome P450